jgi:hypothetical protein
MAKLRELAKEFEYWPASRVFRSECPDYAQNGASTDGESVCTTLLLISGWPEAIGLITYVAVVRETLITSR